MDAANILKPALARGELRAIGATTLNEYQKYFEKGNGAQKYGIKIGKYVPIDSLYFSESAKLLESFVNNF